MPTPGQERLTGDARPDRPLTPAQDCVCAHSGRFLWRHWSHSAVHFARFEKPTGRGNTTLFVFLGTFSPLALSRTGLQFVLATPSPLAASYVPDHRPPTIALARHLGTYHDRFSSAADALFSQPGRRSAKSHQRSRAPSRQHLAFADPCCSPAMLIGVVIALVTGICIGWFAAARYWGMPLLESRSARSRPRPGFRSRWSSLRQRCFPPIGLIALAVWFPVTMLTASGISNTRASYLDVARTLGASRALSDLPRRHSGRHAEHFHRPFHGTRRFVSHADRRRNRRREIRPRLVCRAGRKAGPNTARSMPHSSSWPLSSQPS